MLFKDRIHCNELRSSKNGFYNFALKNFQQNLVSYLRSGLNSEEKQVVANLRFRDSKKDVLIQLSDMVAGSIRRYYDKEVLDCELYRKVLKKKEDSVWEFG